MRTSDRRDTGPDSIPLPSLRDALLVQCRPRDLQAVRAVISERRRTGVVVTDSRLAGSGASARHLINDLDPSTTLLDVAAYAGRGRKSARASFSSRWITIQRDLGLTVLPDAGYAAKDDDIGLKNVLVRTTELGPDAIAPIAADPSWFDERRRLPQLLDLVQEAGTPIAVFLEHRADPLSARRTMRGVLRLVHEATAPVFVLRCDISAVGLLCHGAHTAAVGTTTSLRHNYPIIKSSGPGRPAQISTIVRECLAYVSREKIFKAARADPENQLWTCWEACCAGQSVARLQMLPDADAEAAAFAHSINALLTLRSELLTSTQRGDRTASWASACDNAQFRLAEMSSLVPSWPAPVMLTNWTREHPTSRALYPNAPARRSEP